MALSRATTSGEWTTLPAAGRKGRAPAWPLTKATARETTIWRRLWKMPQAVMWEQAAQHHLVALYVRRLVEAEYHGAPVTISTWVRQMADSLGLTTPGLRSNRWIIADTSEQTAPSPKASKRPTSRRRLQVVGSDVEGT